MAIVVNKTTFDVLESQNTPDFPTSDWVINPASLAALIAGSVPKRYWKVDPGPPEDVIEMTAPEKVAVDTGPLLTTVRQEHRAALFNAARAYIESRYTSEIRDAFLTLMVQGQGTFPTRQALIKTQLDWLETVYAEVKVRRDTVNAAIDIPAVLAVSLDFTSFNGTDPAITIFDVLDIVT
jgi:hypothetical protein